MKSLKYLLTFALIIMSSAYAQDEEVIVINEVIAGQINYEGMAKQIWNKGFDADPASFIRTSINNLEIFDRKSGLTYNFLKASSLQEAKAACRKINHRLASFTEIERLHSISDVPEISKLISMKSASEMVFGFNDDEYDYFKMNVKTGEVEFFKRPQHIGLSPAVCVK